jgi:hypothetical protein
VRVARVVEDVRAGDAGFVIAADLRTLDGVGEDDELLRMREGEGAQEHTFDDGEDGGGGADAEGQHEHGGERETGRFGEMANGDLQVTQHEKLLAGLWVGTAAESESEEARWFPDTVAGKCWFHRRLGRRGTNGVSGTVRRCPDQDGRGGRRGGAHVHAASRVRATAGRRGFGFGGKVFQHNSMAVGRGKFADEGGGSSERAVARAARTAGARDRVGGEDPQAACLQSSALSWFLARWQPAI